MKPHLLKVSLEPESSFNIRQNKGPNFYTLEADQIKLAQENWKVIEEKSIEVPGTEGRLIIGFESRNVPCGTGINTANQLVKVTSLK